MSSKVSVPGGRTDKFSRNSALEDLLQDVNASLWSCEKRLLNNQTELKYPVIIIVGPMRSGTTLFMQWLAGTGLFAYPTNLLSRFYQVPIIGAKIQLLLTDARYNFRGELGDFSHELEYESENGKTRGVLSPNEFWYFWRRFLLNPQQDVWSDEELRESFDSKTMLAELSGVMGVFQKPFAAKGILFNYNIPYLDSLFDKALFVYVKRDPAANIASVLKARERQFGSEETWYSFKIPEYRELEGLDPMNQVAGQVYYMNRAVTKGMSTLQESRKLVVDYEDFCIDPGAFFHELTSRVGLGSPEYHGPERFEPRRKESAYDLVSIMNSIQSFYTE